MKSHETINAKVEKEIYINKQQNVDKNEKKKTKKKCSAMRKVSIEKARLAKNEKTIFQFFSNIYQIHESKYLNVL